MRNAWAELRLLKRHHDNALANISGNAVPDPIALRRLVFERLRPAGSVPIIPAIKRRWLDTEHLKRSPGRQMPLELALAASGRDRARVVYKPRLLSDNGSSYISSDLAEWLKDRGMVHIRGAPCHPQTQGKIERWHQTLKNRILLENYYLPGDLEAQIARFVEHNNYRRYHESLQNLTPADVYFGRGQTILLERERIKRDTIKLRRLQHRLKAA